MSWWADIESELKDAQKSISDSMYGSLAWLRGIDAWNNTLDEVNRAEGCVEDDEDVMNLIAEMRKSGLEVDEEGRIDTPPLNYEAYVLHEKV